LSNHEQQQSQTAESTGEARREKSPVYTIDGLDKEFRQSESVTHLAKYTYRGRAEERYHEYVILLSQDCDLLWDYKDIEKGNPGDLNGILIYEAETVPEIKTKFPAGRDLWSRIVKNSEDRYHYLEETPAELDLVAEGIPALVIDFKRYFTIPPRELYRQCALAHGARRRCRLEMPYSEPAFYLQRVMLTAAA
jgi:hypothetical protein